MSRERPADLTPVVYAWSKDFQAHPALPKISYMFWEDDAGAVAVIVGVELVRSGAVIHARRPWSVDVARRQTDLSSPPLDVLLQGMFIQLGCHDDTPRRMAERARHQHAILATGGFDVAGTAHWNVEIKEDEAGRLGIHVGAKDGSMPIPWGDIFNNAHCWCGLRVTTTNIDGP